MFLFNSIAPDVGGDRPNEARFRTASGRGRKDPMGELQTDAEGTQRHHHKR